MFSVPCVYYGYSTRGCIHLLEERCNIFRAIGANTSPAAKGSTRRVSGRPVLQIIRQAERTATPRPDKNVPLCPPRQKYSIMLWNTHCEGIIPADMTDMTVDMPFCVFGPSRPSSTVLMSFYIIRLLPVACKLSYALLARTHARFTARTEGGGEFRAPPHLHHALSFF